MLWGSVGCLGPSSGPQCGKTMWEETTWSQQKLLFICAQTVILDISTECCRVAQIQTEPLLWKLLLRYFLSLNWCNYDAEMTIWHIQQVYVWYWSKIKRQKGVKKNKTGYSRSQWAVFFIYLLKLFFSQPEGAQSEVYIVFISLFLYHSVVSKNTDWSKTEKEIYFQTQITSLCVCG